MTYMYKIADERINKCLDLDLVVRTCYCMNIGIEQQSRSMFCSDIDPCGRFSEMVEVCAHYLL